MERLHRRLLIGIVATLVLAVGIVFVGDANASSAAIPTPTQSNNIRTVGAATATAKPTSGAPVSSTPGPMITSPALPTWTNVTLRQTTLPPAISQQGAMQVVADRGVAWGLGGQVDGKTVTVTAVHGLGTIGHPGDTASLHLPQGGQVAAECVNWLGPCHFPTQQCAKGVCAAAGPIIGRVENRPLWILDYGNTTFVTSHSVLNHSVYAVDEVTRSVLQVWGYQGP